MQDAGICGLDLWILNCWFWVSGWRSCVLNGFDHVCDTIFLELGMIYFPYFPIEWGRVWSPKNHQHFDFLTRSKCFFLFPSCLEHKKRVSMQLKLTRAGWPSAIHCREIIPHGLSQVSIHDPFKNRFCLQKTNTCLNIVEGCFQVFWYVSKQVSISHSHFFF